MRLLVRKIGAGLLAAGVGAAACGITGRSSLADTVTPEPGIDEAPAPEPDGAELLPEELFGEEPPGASDPLEPMNRAVFRGNRFVQRWLFNPLTRGYRWAVPERGRTAVSNVFENLGEPVVLANDLLQLEPRRAWGTTRRLVLNTTVGLGGLFEPSLYFGLERHQADFGQTLGRAGLGPGFYLMLPILGPSTLRDAVGGVIDIALRPDTWLLSPGGRLVVGGGAGVSRNDQTLDQLEALESASLDFYVTLRGVYLMDREAQINPRQEGPRSETAAVPLRLTRSTRSEPRLGIRRVAWTMPAQQAVASTPDPARASQVVADFQAVLLEVMKQADALGYGGRRARLEPALEAAFDLSFMARQALGRHWNGLTEQQREHFEQSFDRLALASYAGRFDGYSGERFEVLDQQPSVLSTVLVRTRLAQSDGNEVKLDYRLRSEAGSWRIIDVFLNGTVSELALRRSEYSSVIKRDGFDKLIEGLEQQIADFETSPGP